MDEEQLKPETIYILGAGFSYAANVPLQREILGGIRALRLMDLPPVLSEGFLDAQNKIFDFIGRVFETAEDPRLEDVFTLIDQSIQRKNHCLGYNWQDLQVIRSALFGAVVLLLHTKEDLMASSEKDLYDAVAAVLIERRVAGGQEAHPFSVVSLNWDCVLENAIYRCLDPNGLTEVDIDYCCYTTPLQGPDGKKANHVPSILQKARGLYNIKLMKLHGSINCVICPNCNRLYAGLHAPREWMEEYLANKICPRCARIAPYSWQGKGDSPILEPLLISPTFLKELDNTHIQMIWHNAYVDLCEAQKLVFIGYSLPEADYHLRTLLKRAIRRDAEITIVLTKGDNPAADCPAHIRDKYAVTRYRAFFGSEPRITVRCNGMRDYFQHDIEARTVAQRLASVKGMLHR
jgi:hypothetical protein